MIEAGGTFGTDNFIYSFPNVFNILLHLGPDGNYGAALIKTGQTEQRLGQVRKVYLKSFLLKNIYY